MTKLEKFIKKKVVTFLTHVTLIKHMAVKLMSRHKELKIAEKQKKTMLRHNIQSQQ